MFVDAAGLQLMGSNSTLKESVAPAIHYEVHTIFVSILKFNHDQKGKSPTLIAMIELGDQDFINDRSPILIIPGFMSSGLVVETSEILPRWNGKKLWLNLKRLGFTGKILADAKTLTVQGKASKSSDKNISNIKFGAPIEVEIDDAQLRMRDDWLAHMLLQPNMTSEQPGVRIRPVPGLDGVAYLEDNALIQGNTYVFGKLIKYLVSAGDYKEGIDLDARPYDWRIPPDELERRDSYFSDTLKRIEKMSFENDGRKVVLCCHSMGVNCGHYLLNFAERIKGRNWLDTYVEAFMTLGGPHLGAPCSTKAVIDGDNMGLPSAFLKSDTALQMGRSFGASLWLQTVEPDGKLET